MIKKVLATAAATGALLAAGAGVAIAQDPEAPGQQPPAPVEPEEKEDCMKLLELPLPLVEPPTKLGLTVCQEKEDEGGSGGGALPALPPVTPPAL